MPRFSWLYFVALASLGWALIYFDRMMFTPIMGTLSESYGLSVEDLGLVFSLFFLGYTLLQIPGGLLGDRWGTRQVIELAFLGMALVSVLSGFFTTFGAFVVLRFLSGAFEGLFYGPLFAVSTHVIPTHRKVLATTLINSGMSIGIILGTTLPVWMVGKGWSYQWLYAVVGGGALALWLSLRAVLPVVRQQPKPLRFTMTRPLARVFLVLFASLYGFFTVLTWLQQYLSQEKLLDTATVASAMMLISVVSIVSSLVFSYLVDKFQAPRAVTMLLLLMSAVSLLGLVYAHTPETLMWMVLLYGLFGKMALDPILIIMVGLSRGESSLSTTLSIFNFAGLLSAVVAPYIGGKLYALTGTLDWAYLLCALLLLLALIPAMGFRLALDPEKTTP